MIVYIVGNKSGFPVKIIENGKPRIIPPRVKCFIEDDTYTNYKDLFHVFEHQKPQEVERKFTEEQFDKYLNEVKRNSRPCENASIRKENYIGENGVKQTSIYMKKRKKTPKNRIVWNVISPEGERYDNIDIKDWAKSHGYAVNNVYKYADANKPFNGWTIEKILTEKVQRQSVFNCTCKRCHKKFEAKAPSTRYCPICKEFLVEHKHGKK